MKRAYFALPLSFALLAGCGRGGGTTWHADDISGAMPRLQFSMIRANDDTPVTAADYRGRVVVLYFGYTNCPDICPTTLSDLADVLGKLGAHAADVRVLFVTVDPNRDTRAVLKRYAKVFAAEIDGLRGTESEIESLAHRYHVAYSVTPASPGHPYTVTHSSAIFIFDPKGNARLLSLTSDDTKGVAQDVESLIQGDRTPAALSVVQRLLIGWLRST